MKPYYYNAFCLCFVATQNIIFFYLKVNTSLSRLNYNINVHKLLTLLCVPVLTISYRIRGQNGPSFYCSPVPGLDFPASHYADNVSDLGHSLTLALQIPSHSATDTHKWPPKCLYKLDIKIVGKIKGLIGFSEKCWKLKISALEL